MHWVHAAAFFVLLASGLCLYLPSLAEVVGRRPLLKHVHVYTALAWAVAIVAVVVVGDRRSLARTVNEVDYLRTDTRLNKGQKLNALLTAVFAILFAVSGFDLWLGERNTSYRLTNALLVHDWLMYASLVLVVGHLYFVLILPSTRHSLSGMTRGWVRRDYAERQHPEWLAELER